ncbi:MAG: DUF1501 domain-containing protein [Chloroflexi bacterium]|nr:DUF1501 domain-containing protein [Chloroflexota bacterium]
MSFSFSRRDFLKTAAALPAWMLAPEAPRDFLPRFAFFSPKGQEPRANILVCIFLRGGMDGLHAVIPHGDADYYRLRPRLAIPEPSPGNDRTGIDLDGFFGLHPSMRPLKDLWDDKGLAFVHAAGSPNPTRSHFDAMDYMERGTPGDKQVATGWLARHLQFAAHENGSPFRVVGFGAALPSSLRGPIPAIALRSIADFHLGGRYRGEVEQFQNMISSMYASDAALGERADFTLDAVQLLQSVVVSKYQPANKAQYPDSEFGQSLMQVAQLIKAQIGVEVAAVDLGGWDTHITQGQFSGDMPNLLADLSAALAAFYLDLGDMMKRVTVTAMSEFGRRAIENGGLGTDHGHGNVMMVLGKSINGGRVFGQWPGLSNEKLVGPGDLAITTDFRSVLGELVSKHLQNPFLDQVFPNFTDYQPLGIADNIST